MTTADSPDTGAVDEARRREAVRLLEARHYGQAIAIFEEVLREQQEEHPAELQTIRTANFLAKALFQSGQAARAAEVQERVLLETMGAVGDRHPSALVARYNLILYLRGLGHWTAALGEARELVSIMRGGYDPGPLGLDDALAVLAATLRRSGDRAGAEPVDRELVELCVGLEGPESRAVLRATSNLALGLHQRGERVEALALISEARRGARATLDRRDRLRRDIVHNWWMIRSKVPVREVPFRGVGE